MYFSGNKIKKGKSMKRVGMMAMLAFGFAASVMAQEPSVKGRNQESFALINRTQLSKYLQLTNGQQREVGAICDYFEDQMQNAERSRTRKTDRMRKAVYGNLKLMKRTLDEKQYKNYLRLMQTTLNNRGIDLAQR